MPAQRPAQLSEGLPATAETFFPPKRLVLYSLNSALRQEEAIGERMEAVLAVLFPGEDGETT